MLFSPIRRLKLLLLFRNNTFYMKATIGRRDIALTGNARSRSLDVDIGVDAMAEVGAPLPRFLY